MDQKLLFRLKEFLTLENAQVLFYKTQANSATDEYYAYVFKRLMEIEQDHVDFFANLVEKTGESVPLFIDLTAKLGMTLIGESVELKGKQNACSLGAKFESKAIETYTTFIDECNQKKYTELRDTLMEFRLEEEFHKLWLEDYARNHPH